MGELDIREGGFHFVQDFWTKGLIDGKTKVRKCENEKGRRGENATAGRNDFMNDGVNEGWRDRRREDGKMLCLRKKFYWGERVGGNI